MRVGSSCVDSHLTNNKNSINRRRPMKKLRSRIKTIEKLIDVNEELHDSQIIVHVSLVLVILILQDGQNHKLKLQRNNSQPGIFDALEVTNGNVSNNGDSNPSVVRPQSAMVGEGPQYMINRKSKCKFKSLKDEYKVASISGQNWNLSKSKLNYEQTKMKSNRYKNNLVPKPSRPVTARTIVRPYKNPNMNFSRPVSALIPPQKTSRPPMVKH